jgi:hypothetical protein
VGPQQAIQISNIFNPLFITQVVLILQPPFLKKNAQ